MRVTRVRYDFDNNGIFEGERVYNYDTSGRIASVDYTYTSDGVTDTDFRSFSIAPKINEQVDVVYGADGRVQRWLTDSTASAAEFAYVWRSDGRLDDATLTITAKAQSLTVVQDLAFSYNTGNLLAQWVQTGSVAGTNTTITTGLSYTGSVLSSDLGTTAFTTSTGQSGSSQDRHEYTWTASGKLDLVRVTVPTNPAYLSRDDYQYDANDRLSAHVHLPNDPADNATWRYLYDGSSDRVTTWTIDMASNGSTEARMEIEWESGACQVAYAWAPRARPNFVATGHAPHVPGTGIFVFSPCAGYGVGL